MQVSPNQNLPASYTISAPGDTTLYYVQAVLRDTQSSSILQTLKLARVSTVPNRYSGVFDPVNDPSGLGRLIDITISVFTDAGYTTLSQNYAVLNLSYLVTTSLLQSGYSAGVGTDYRKIEEIILAVLTKNLPKQLKGVRGGIDAIRKSPVKYALIESMIKDAHKGAAKGLAEALETHHKTFSDFMTEGLNKLGAFSAQNHGETVASVVARLEAMEKVIGGVGESSEKGSTSMRAELKQAITDAKKELTSNHAQHAEKLAKSVQSILETHREETGKLVGEKSISLQLKDFEQPKKEPKGKVAPDVHMERAQKLLS